MTFSPLFADSKDRPIALPTPGAGLADTHAHLDMLDDPALAIARAALAGIAFIATVADVTEDAWRTYDELPVWLGNASELLDADPTVSPGTDLPTVRVILGAHPHNAKDWTPDAEKVFRQFADDPRTCAVGELGLDYHYDHSPRDAQRDAMAAHLKLAHEFSLPAVIHLREAHDDGLAILREVSVPPAGAILHCYTLGPAAMRPFLDLGCHVSFAGPVTFKKAEEVRDAAREVPAGRLLTETDCPFMAPEPFRGRANEPALVVFTAARLAEARGEDVAAFAGTSLVAARALLDRDRA